MTDTFRAMCAELLAALESEGYAHWSTPPDEDELCLRARALLAQPEPEGLTDDGLGLSLSQREGLLEGLGHCFSRTSAHKYLKVWSRDYRAAIARALLAQPVAEGPTDEELNELFNAHCYTDDFGTHLMDAACFRECIRAATLLSQLSAPTPQPVAVSERLPGPEDCDEQGRCWVGGGQLVSGSPTWILGYSAWASRFPDVHYCWLPANALPTPENSNG